MAIVCEASNRTGLFMRKYSYMHKKSQADCAAECAERSWISAFGFQLFVGGKLAFVAILRNGGENGCFGGDFTATLICCMCKKRKVEALWLLFGGENGLF